MNTFEPAFQRTSLRDFSLPDFVKWCSEFELAAYRAKQLYNAVHKMRYTKFSQMTVLSAKFREWLETNLILSPFVNTDILHSTDKSKKLIFTLYSKKSIESVWIPEHYGNTLCISTQTGCAGKCVFCQTGKIANVVNLSVAEMISQVYDTEELLKSEASNLVVMGMGEPLLNLKPLLKALDILVDTNARNFSKRKVTISTIGILSGLGQLIDSLPGYNLSLSLHFSDQQLREKFMPLTAKNPLENVLSEIETYRKLTDCKVSIEYIMFSNVNDYKHDAENLARLLRGLHWHINLLEYNPVQHAYHPLTQKVLQPSPREKIEQFQNYLKSKGFEVNIRTSRGQDIGAACGQLGKTRTTPIR